jgi:PAS domain S-box-containing protein
MRLAGVNSSLSAASSLLDAPPSPGRLALPFLRTLRLRLSLLAVACTAAALLVAAVIIAAATLATDPLASIESAGLYLGLGSAVLLATGLALAFLGAPLIAEPFRRRIAEADERFSAVADTVPGILFVGHGSGYCDFVSARFYEYTGMAPGSARGFGWSAVIHSEDRVRIQALLVQPDGAAPACECQLRLRQRNGSHRWFAIRTHAISDAETSAQRWVGIATDIEDHKQAEARLSQLSMQLMQAEDRERRRIAREIHDTTVQNLAAVALEIDQIRSGAIASPEAIAETLVEAHDLVGQSLQELRTLTYFFHPPMLDELGLGSAIRWYARGLAKRTGLRIALEIPEAMPRMSEAVECVLFRVVQEALANVHRHSGSKDARIRIHIDADGIALEIRDNGKGIAQPLVGDDDGAPPGVGIAGMRLRLQQIGGSLKIETSALGTAVIATARAMIDHRKAAA